MNSERSSARSRPDMNNSIRIPDRLKRSIRRYFSDEGEAWLLGLPELVQQAAQRWQLDLGEPSHDAGAGFVCLARDGQDRSCVLKVAFPHDEHLSGVQAMRIYDGRGCVEILDTAENDSQVLMERIVPGTQLHELRDEAEEARVVARVIRSLHRPPPTEHTLSPHSSWVDKALRYIAASDIDESLLPARLVRTLEQTVSDLESLHRPVVLHGDLHHENILSDDCQFQGNDGQRHWLAIDPKGLVGDPALDVGRYVQNKNQQGPDQGARTQLRLDVLARELDEPLERLRAAAAVDVIICMGWELEKPDIDAEDLSRRRDLATIILGW
jgi:streptomycin 6-kinase